MMRIMLIVFVGLVSACSGMEAERYIELDSEEMDVIKMEEKLSNLHFEITSLAERGRCDENNQCQTIAVGIKPCGGPRYFYAYSISSFDAGSVVDRVSEYNRLDSKLNNKRQDISECYVISDPGAQCFAGKCMTR